VEREAEFKKLVSRGSDYDELLRAGYLVTQAEDPENWRRTMREKARADKLEVRTGVARDDPDLVWAYLKHLDDQELSAEERASVRRQGDTVEEARERARLRGHKSTRLIRVEGTRGAGTCEDCGARLYLDWSEEPPFMEGEAFEADCPARNDDIGV
jgi:hypothetical protein